MPAPMDERTTNDPLPGAALTDESAADVETVARGGALQIVGQATHRSLSFFFNAIAFRVLGRSLFGVYGVVTQTLAIASEIGLLGFHTAALRFVTRARATGDPGQVKGSIRVALTGVAIASFLSATALVLGGDLLASAFADDTAQRDDISALLRYGALYVPLFALVQVLRYTTQAYKTMLPSVVMGNIIQPGLQFLIGTAALAMGFALVGAVTALIVSTAIAATVGVVFVRKLLSAEEKRAAAHRQPRAMLRFALPQAGAQLVGLQGLGLGILLLGARSTSGQVALFAVALALQGPAGVFQAGALNIWAPMVSDLHDRGEIARLARLYATVTRWIATFALPISAAMMIEPEIFALFFGGEDARAAAPVIAILALANAFQTIAGPSIYVLTMTRHPGVNFVTALAALVVYASAGWLVAGDHGAVGVAWVDAGVAASLATARVAEAYALVGVHPFAASLLKPLGATAGASAVLLAWRAALPGSIGMTIAGTVVAAGVYLTLLAVAGVDEEERHVWNLIRRRAPRTKRP